MNKKIAIALSIVTLLCVASLGQVLGQTRTPGVGVSDYFVYNISSHWSSDNATSAAPDWLAEWNLTKEYKVMIGQTQGVNVTSTQTWDFTNGTQVPYLLTIDIDSGAPYYLSAMAPPFEGIIGANLNPGDLLHPSGNNSVTINQTVTRNYAGGSRDTNVIDLTGPVKNQTTDPLTNETVYEEIGSQEVLFYIDKATGMLVEKQVILKSTSPAVEEATVTWTLKETNRWDASPPMNILFIIIIAVAIVAVVAVALVVVFRGRGKGRKKLH